MVNEARPVVLGNQARAEETSGLEEEVQEAMGRVNREVEVVVPESEKVMEAAGPIEETRDRQGIPGGQVAQEVQVARAVQVALEERIAETAMDNQTRTTRCKGRW